MTRYGHILVAACGCVALLAAGCSAGHIGTGPDAGSGDADGIAADADRGDGADEDGGTSDAGADRADGDGSARDAGGHDAGMDGGHPDAADGADPGGCVDDDGDGYCREDDCDDVDRDIHPGADEVCGNAVDDDCDGDTDEGCQAGEVFHVDRDGLGGACSDDGPGSIGAPWCTIEKANATLDAGDTVLIRAGTYQETIQPEHAGASDAARIVYAAYPGESVVIRDVAYGIRLVSVSYVTVSGIDFVDCGRNVYMSASDHNVIGDCTFDNPSGPATWAGSRLYEGSTHNRIHDCVFSRYGEESYYAGGYQDAGCILDIGNDNEIDRSDRNLVEHCTFFHGGHHILGVYANHNVIRDNTFHNEEWYPCNRDDIGGLCGNRNVVLNTSHPEENTRNIIQDNWIVFSGVPPDQVSSAGLSVRTRSNIIRRNIFTHCDSSGVALSADGGNTNDASDNHIYHNVFYHNGYLLLDDWDPRKNGLMLARWVDDAGHNPMTGVAIKNNIFHQNNLQAMYFYYVDRAEQEVAGNREEVGDPGFVDLEGQADPFDFGVFDFHLAPQSPCIDNGGFLTRTTGAGQDSTSLVIEDAGYFTDGAGVIEGDRIQLKGQSTRAGIVGIDYDTNTLTLDTPLSWQAGTGVSLPYEGARPDQGVFEHPGN